jgi:hypothetical protein
MASSMVNYTFTFSTFYCDNKVGQESSGSIATCYGLGGLGIQSRWGKDFPQPPSPLYNGYRVFPGDKAARHGVYHPPPSSAEVKEIVELYH